MSLLVLLMRRPSHFSLDASRCQTENSQNFLCTVHEVCACVCYVCNVFLHFEQIKEKLFKSQFISRSIHNVISFHIKWVAAWFNIYYYLSVESLCKCVLGSALYRLCTHGTVRNAYVRVDCDGFGVDARASHACLAGQSTFCGIPGKTTQRKCMIDATHQDCKVNRHYACDAGVFQPGIAGKLDELTHS